MQKKYKNVLVICGPTASGKTSLALQLAKELETCNILSVDSRQLYKSLDIITGKDIPDNLPQSIKVFGHDLFSPDQVANLGDFVRIGDQVIQDSISSNTPLVIVGGTGLYLNALTQNLSDATIPPDLELRKKLEKLTLQQLQEYLRNENSDKLESLNRSDFMNPRRLIRAIEISKNNSSPNTKVKPISFKKNINFHWIGIMPEKQSIKDSIKNRVLERIREGAVNEVKQLLAKYKDTKLPIYTSLGVSQIMKFISGLISEKELIESWTNAEVDYARRQIVWFKKQPGIVWYDKSIDGNTLVSKASKLYK